jgi:hypothetical protein
MKFFVAVIATTTPAMTIRLATNRKNLAHSDKTHITHRRDRPTRR